MKSEPKSPDKVLRLNDEWRVITDEANYILQRRRVVQKKDSKNFGQEAWIDWAYHGRLQDLFSTICEQFIRDNWFDVEKILKSIEDIRQKISVLTSYKGV